MTDSILNSTKKVLGLGVDYTPFDLDITMHINSVFFTLQQLGIGPDTGFMIQDAETTWNAFLEDDLNLNAVKTYMYLRVRMLFDPPTTSYLITALEKQVQELEWRLNVHRETTQWEEPLPVFDPVGYVVDGGGAEERIR